MKLKNGLVYIYLQKNFLDYFAIKMLLTTGKVFKIDLKKLNDFCSL